MNHFLSIAKNELKQLLRDLWLLTVSTAGSVGVLIVVAYTYSTDIDRVPTVVLNYDAGSESRTLIERLERDDFFAVSGVESRAQAERLIEQGQAKIFLFIPADFTRKVRREEAAQVQAIIDGSQPDTAELALGHIKAIARYTSWQLTVDSLTRRGQDASLPLELRLRVRYNARLRNVESVLPGLMGMVMAVSPIGAAAAFARERERGNFELLISTPARRWALVLGRMVPYLLLGLINFTFLTLVGVLGFGVPFRGSELDFFLLGLVFIYANLGLGLLVAGFTRTQHAAMVSTFFIFAIPPLFLSDIFFPVASMATWLQRVAYLLPATHFTQIARGVFLKGVGLEILWPNALFLLALGTVSGLLSYLRFKKKLD